MLLVLQEAYKKKMETLEMTPDTLALFQSWRLVHCLQSSDHHMFSKQTYVHILHIAYWSCDCHVISSSLIN